MCKILPFQCDVIQLTSALWDAMRTMLASRDTPTTSNAMREEGVLVIKSFAFVFMDESPQGQGE